MKKKNIYISLYVLIPLIYTGITMIGVILTYELFKHKGNVSRIDNSNFIYVIIAIAALTLFISFIVLRLFFEPLIKFFNKTQKMPIIAPPREEEQKSITSDLKQMGEFFDNVTSILSKVEAQRIISGDCRFQHCHAQHFYTDYQSCGC